MRIGFTGTQIGLSQNQGRLVTTLMRDLKNITEFHHGDCIEADETAHKIASSLLFSTQADIIIHPPVDSSKRAYCDKLGSSFVVSVLPERDYLDRNHDIVDAVDLLIACPKSHVEELRSGTWATIRYAYKIGRPVMILV